MRNFTKIRRPGPALLRSTAIAFLSAVFLLSGGTAFGADSEIAGKVIDALGGRERLEAVQTVRTSASGINFGAMNSYSSEGPPIHLSDVREDTLWEPHSQRFRVHARLNALVPFPGAWDFEEAFDGTYATRGGEKDYRPGESSALPGAYLGARLKKLWLDHPQWLFLKATEITSAGVRSVDGKTMPVLAVSALDETWRITIDPETFLPRSVAVHEVDGLRGDILIEIGYGDWRDIGGIMMPHQITQTTGGARTRRELRGDIQVGTVAGDGGYLLGDSAGLEQPDPADVTWGWGMTHWFLGRLAMGRSADVRRQTPVELRQIADGIFQATGTSHHNLVIVGADALTVIEAPFYPQRSKTVLAAIRERWPGKPVRNLILTHHHTDHVGGFREYVEAGAKLIVPAANVGFFEEVLSTSGTRKTEIIPVVERYSLSGFGQPVEIITVPNSHAHDMIVVYFPDRKLLFATDIYSPGRPDQPPNFPGELLNAIRFFDFDVERFIGGHGSGPDDFARFMSFVK